MRVLIADADEGLLEILQSFLWDRGHEVELAGDGLQCLVTLREFAPEVVVLDGGILWGGADGVLHHMQLDPALARTPVILVVDETPAGLREGLDIQSLKKPICLSDLLTQINAAGRPSADSGKSKGRSTRRPRSGTRRFWHTVPESN